MREIAIYEESFSSGDAVHAYLASELGFPAYYGANLDALNDCLGDMDSPVALTVYLSDEAAELGADPGAQDTRGAYLAWFPKLVRCLLHASRDNECIELIVHATSLHALGRLAACPGLAALLDDEHFIVQGVIASLGGEDGDEDGA